MSLHETYISPREPGDDILKTHRGESITHADSFSSLLEALSVANPGEIQQLIEKGLITQDEFDVAIDQIAAQSEVSTGEQNTWQSIGQEAVKVWSEYVSIDNIVFPHAAEEVWDDEWDEPPILEIADVLDDKQAGLDFRQIEMSESMQKLRTILESLSDRDLNIIRLRTSKEEPLSFAKIGSLSGIAASTARNTFLEVLNKLRHHMGDEQLGEYCPLVVANDNSSEAVIPRKHMFRDVTPEGIALGESEIVAPELPVILEELSAEGQQELEDQASYNLFEQLLLNAAPGNFKTSLTYTQQTPYPREAYNEIEDRLGVSLTAKHIEKFWNVRSEQWLHGLEESLGDELDLNRVGQLISALLQTRMRDTDSIRLRMPETSRKIGYLGAWASQGEIIIEGDVGDFLGVNMTGAARIIVLGNVGKAAGAQARNRAYLKVTGDAGDYLAYCAGDEVTIIVEGTAGKKAAIGVRQKPEIYVNGRVAFLTQEENDGEGLFDFDTICERLDLNPTELEYYRGECKYPSKIRSFTEVEITGIFERFPELAMPRCPEGFTSIVQAKIKLRFKGYPKQLEEQLSGLGIEVHKFRDENNQVASFVADHHFA